ncbi:MAG: undecaprenyldiphospho-muramoylpentapeptide beta-N-acetylglucosaminyltransferase [Fidelibacterota bacterium]|nr:MAG: undecaprenyldiphospho-muramoylpentapeptide beta-N-acetylglucosaminyltransferase [Candidatus Neomarinimicrobiota bacterium]
MPGQDHNRLRVLMAGGGTGGHLYPALAIARGLREAVDECDIRFSGSIYGLEARILPEENEVFYPLKIRGIQRGLGPVSLARNLVFPWRFFRSRWRCRRILQQFKPHVVVGTGGYASGLPLMSAQRRGIPTLIHEQNSYPGITTRRLARKASLVCLTYKSSVEYLHSDGWILTGNPVRFGQNIPSRRTARQKLGLPARGQVLFILGGSQGSRPLNRHFKTHWQVYTEEMGAHLLWQTGTSNYKRLSRSLGSEKGVNLVPFIKDMASAYMASDLVVCRAGALTLSELTALGKPSVLVPLPSAAADHQTKNAKVLVNHNAARMVLQSDLARGALERIVKRLIKYPDRLKAMSKRASHLAQSDATENIVEHILRLAEA